jgi:tetratricopeptide (TPR) repeat protein
MNELSKLKERGNDAFKSKKFDKAIDLFKKAIEIEEESPLKDAKLLAVLQSNIAQAYLELKK